VAFRILSWNIETFGETKVAGIENFVARVIRHSGADLVFILESTMRAQGDVAHRIWDQLQAITGQAWVPFGSDPTGKSLYLPPKLGGKAFPTVCDLGAYRPVLLLCYTETAPKFFELKPEDQINPDDVPTVRAALEVAGVLRRDVETYTGFFRFDPAVYKQYQAYVALGSYVALSKAQPGSLVSTDWEGNEIGYADPQSQFNGRRPFLANLYFGEPANPSRVERYVPTVAFHAPFSSNLWVRAAANVGLLKLGTSTATGQRIPLRAQPTAIVCGDFNVDFDWNEDFSGLTLPVPQDKGLNATNYGSFYAAGFRMTIRELTSLKAVNANLEPVTNPVAFRANGYDNVMVKSDGNAITNAIGGAIDLVSDAYYAYQGNGNYLSWTSGLPVCQRPYDAFKYVREEVSDHLPALCELTVPARP